VRAAIPDAMAEKPVEFWYQDEARVGQQGTPTRVWATRGSRPRALRDHRFDWAYLFGAACPARGVGAAIVMPEVNITAMNEHLAVISRNVTAGAIAVLISMVLVGTVRPASKCRKTSCYCGCHPTRPNLTQSRTFGLISEAIISVTASTRIMKPSSTLVAMRGTL
jgi:hypothetical protein